MIKERIKKDQINKLIDTLIRSGGGKSQYGKLNDIVKLYTSQSNILRRTLLIWLDSMSIMEVNNENQYELKRPVWAKSAIANHYILLGAVTADEAKSLERNSKIKKYDKNNVDYKNIEIELPDTYYTNEIEVFDEFDYEVVYNPIFTAIDNMEGMSLIEEKLYHGNLEKIIISEQEVTNGIDGYKITLDIDNNPLYIYPEDDIKQFNWRTRSYIKCDLIKELNIADDEDGLKLIKVTKSLEGSHKEYFTLLLEKTNNEDWIYVYFNPISIDERWSRYLYIDRLEYYDIEKDFRRRGVDVKGFVAQNAMSAIDNNCEFITHPPISTNFIKIPGIIKKQLVQYDSRKGLMAFPVNMPLPREIMRYLFSCSGVVPKVINNKFVLNPDYNIKRLFSGVLSPAGINMAYPSQKYFMEEDFYLFSSVPTELAEKIFEKLNLDMKRDVLKRAFLQKV